MKRRAFVLGGWAATVLAAAGAAAQTARQFRVGFLATSDEATAKPFLETFLAGLAERGYHQGKNLILDFRSARGDLQRLPALAAELVALKPDVMVGLQSAAIAMRAKSTTIPIVLLASADPVAAGLVQSLPRPGTNVTGLTNRFEQVVEKHIELLVEIVPTLSRVAFLHYAPSHPTSAAAYESAVRRAAAGKGLSLFPVTATDEATLRAAFAQIEAQRPGALVLAATAPALQLRHAIIEHTKRLRIPAISALPPMWAEAGGMLNYGANALADYRYAATFVDRILRGGKPAEMPIEQVSRFELVVNLRTAREIGVAVPRSILARADRVIE